MNRPFSLHNVVEEEPCPTGGFYLRRFPKAVRNILSPLGAMVSEEAAGVEIRFVTESLGFRLALGAEPSCLDPSASSRQEAFVFRGDFFHSRHLLEPGRVNHITVTDIGNAMGARLASLATPARESGRFSPDVWRVFLGRFPAALIELSTFGKPCRAPRPGEVPSRRWLAYGSSITNGGSPTSHHLAYIYQAAYQLGVDVFNQGLSGSCCCEPEVAAYLAARQDWDLMTLEIGVNMRQDFSPEEFAERARHLVQTLKQAHPDKPIVLLSIYPNADLAPFAADADAPVAKRQAAFVETLKRLAEGNVFFVAGTDILRNFQGLTTDLIHPSDFGHIEMGRNLAEKLREHLNK
jgi:lysophospholipase L1-like esterase